MAAYVVMVIEHDPQLLQQIKNCFLTSGCKVVTAADGNDALGKLEIIEPDIIVCEVMAPTMDGYEFYQDVQGLPQMKGVPFIFLAEKGNMDERLSELPSELSDHARKPVDPRDLILRATRLLQSAASRRSAEQVMQGDLSQLGLAELLQTLSMNGKTCAVSLKGDGGQGTVYMREGNVVFAILGDMSPSNALRDMLAWQQGAFQIDFRPVDHPNVLGDKAAALIQEAAEAPGATASAVPDAPPQRKQKRAEKKRPTDVGKSLQERIRDAIITRNYKEAVVHLESLIKVEPGKRELQEALLLLRKQRSKYL